MGSKKGSAGQNKSIHDDKEQFSNNFMFDQQKIAQRTIEITNWKGLAEISQHNDELMNKLNQLRISKRYDAEKFEKILRLPAREVNEFMENEAQKNEDEKMTEIDRIERKTIEETKDRAARTLQKYFRKLRIEKRKKDYNRRINRIKPKRRIELLEQINNRLNERRLLRRIRGLDVIRMYESHRELQKNNYWFHQMVVDVQTHSLNFSRPNSPTHFVAKSIPEFARTKARILHKNEMEKIENDTLKFELFNDEK